MRDRGDKSGGASLPQESMHKGDLKGMQGSALLQHEEEKKLCY